MTCTYVRTRTRTVNVPGPGVGRLQLHSCSAHRVRYAHTNLQLLQGRMLTRKRKITFKQLVDVKLPKAKRIKAIRSESQLYIKVIEGDPSTQRMKIHYIGYSSRYDEWRPASDIVDKRTLVMKEDSTSLRLHAELASRIKSNLSSSRTNSPEVRIEIPFDKDLYNSTSGLKSKGREVKIIRGIMHYSLASYSDLVPILGKNWYIRGFNEAGDCCYVLVETVRFFSTATSTSSRVHSRFEL